MFLVAYIPPDPTVGGSVLGMAELAGLAGITRVSVNAIEGGRMTPSILLALKLAEALQVPVGELFWLRGGKSGDRPG